MMFPHLRYGASVAALMISAPPPGGGGDPTPWTPDAAFDSTELLVWFDASDSSTITLDSGAVSQWNDKSGNNRHAVQATSSKRPVVSAANMNGLDVLTFDGSDDSLYVNSWGSVSQPFTRCMVVDLYSAYDNFDHLINSINASPNTADVFSGGALQQEINGANVNGVSISAPAIFVRVSEFNGSSSAVTMDGTRTAGGSGGSNGFDGIRIVGLDDGGSYKPPVRIAEFFVLSFVPDTTTRQKIEGYLAHKWGRTAALPSDHPFKSVAPTIGPTNTALPTISGTTTEYATLTTTNGTWSGTGSISYSYQWQRNGVDIVGATANTYTLTASDVGNPISCVVTATDDDGPAIAETAATSNIVACFKPTDLANQINWLDGDDTSFMTLSGSEVSAWDDKFGSTRDWSQGTSANRPLLTTNALNGRSVVTFDGSNDQMTAPSLNTGTTMNIMVVLRPHDVSAIRYFFGHATSAAVRLGFTSVVEDARWATRTNNSNSLALAANTWAIRGYGYASSTMNMWFNGVAQSSTTTGTQSGVTGVPYLGANSNGSHFDGDIAELIWYNANHFATASNREKLEGYLAWKWGLTSLLDSGHPYKNAPPTA